MSRTCRRCRQTLALILYRKWCASTTTIPCLPPEGRTAVSVCGRCGQSGEAQRDQGAGDPLSPPQWNWEMLHLGSEKWAWSEHHGRTSLSSGQATGLTLLVL